MIRLHLIHRSDDDDYAPIDYSFVGSFAEGQRQKEGQAIHRAPMDAVVRHRVDPNQPGVVDEYGTRARRSPVAQKAEEGPVRRGLPSLADGPVPVERAAYPQGRGPGPEEGLEAPEPQREREPQSPEAAPPEGAVFDAPVAPDIPEWLRIAQQNNMPLRNRPGAPQVTAAPKPPEMEPQTDLLGRPIGRRGGTRPAARTSQSLAAYEEAGYPPELLQQQYEQEQARLAEEVGNRRHGAQRAVRSPEQAQRRQDAPGPRGRRSYPPARESFLGQSSREAPTEAGSAAEARWGGGGQPQGEAPEGMPRGFVGAYQSPEGYAEDYGPQEKPGYGQPGYAAYAGPRQGGQDDEQQRYAAYPDRRRRREYAPQGQDPYSLPQRGRREEGWQGNPPQSYAPQGHDAYAVPPNPYVVRRERQEEPGNPQAESMPKRRIPWLGIAVVAVAFLAVGLWLMGMSFTNQTNEILRGQQEAAQALRDSHPFRYRELIETQAQINNLHPAYIAAIMLNESSFEADAESSVGARGLMQMMPDTAEWVHGKIAKGQAYSFDQMYDPDTNVRYACWYLNFLSERFRGDPVLVAAAFHAGQGTVQNWLNDSRYSEDQQTIALEDMMDGPTKNYASRVIRAYAVYKRLYYEDTAL